MMAKPIGFQLLDMLIEKGLLAESLRTQEAAGQLARWFIDITKPLREKATELERRVADLTAERDSLRELQAIVNRDGGHGSLQEAIDKAHRYKMLEEQVAGLRELLRDAGALLNMWLTSDYQMEAARKTEALRAEIAAEPEGQPLQLSEKSVCACCHKAMPDDKAKWFWDLNIATCSFRCKVDYSNPIESEAHDED